MTHGTSSRRTLYRSGGKRAFDVVAAGTIGLVSIPIQLVVALLVRSKLGTPVFFRQERPGVNSDPFMLIKFRTMTDEKDEHGNLLPDDARLTRFGQALRSTSLDELPELWNVLRGDMSLVGPRPLLTRYLARYSADQARRHEVLPGITGWSQVNGRNDPPWAEKLGRDVWYVDHYSFALDVKILLKTLGEVVGKRGISAEGHVSSPEFDPEAPA